MTFKIFVKESALKEARALANSTTTTGTSNIDPLDQLRQVRTKFHRPSTYLRCRSFNEFTNDIVTRPFTIFTLADPDIGDDIAQY